MTAFLHVLGTAAVILGTGASWVFVLIYRRRAWRRYEEGVHLMVFTAVIAVILTYVSARALLGSATLTVGDELTRLAIYGAIAWLMCWRVRLLLKAR